MKEQIRIILDLISYFVVIYAAYRLGKYKGEDNTWKEASKQVNEVRKDLKAYFEESKKKRSDESE